MPAPSADFTEGGTAAAGRVEFGLQQGFPQPARHHIRGSPTDRASPGRAAENLPGPGIGHVLAKFIGNLVTQFRQPGVIRRTSRKTGRARCKADGKSARGDLPARRRRDPIPRDPPVGSPNSCIPRCSAVPRIFAYTEGDFPSVDLCRVAASLPDRPAKKAQVAGTPRSDRHSWQKLIRQLLGRGEVTKWINRTLRSWRRIQPNGYSGSIGKLAHGAAVHSRYNIVMNHQGVSNLAGLRRCHRVRVWK